MIGLLGFMFLPFVFRWLARLAAWTIAIITAVMAAPVTVVTIAGLAVAWSRGWRPARLRQAAASSLPMTAIWLAVTAVSTRSLQAVIAAPFTGWVQSWHAFDYGATSTAFVLAAPVAIPAGLYLASVFWAGRIYRMDTGLAGLTATGPVVFDERQWRRQVKAAAARSNAPGPLTDQEGRIVAGGTIRSVGHAWRPVLAIPWTAMGRHQVIIGSSFVANPQFRVIRAEEADRVTEIFQFLTQSMSVRVNSARPDDVSVFDPDELADLSD